MILIPLVEARALFAAGGCGRESSGQSSSPMMGTWGWRREGCSMPSTIMYHAAGAKWRTSSM
eukprot:4365318-Pyramimonas_sp.AAC.1